ncbi:sigma-54 interaction domain-containing protein [Phosphitispora sp. TUW77]|uniref:sigma-54 interaction domain-containing protein n=1 Tax=Phosphitispora sp. TUW77 TaxID=3152361 RepID=UPI003AB7CE32
MILSEKAANYPDSSLILDHAFNGIIAVDKDGYISVFNKTAREFYRFLDDVEGTHIREIMPESPLLVVLETGIPEIGRKIAVNGRECIANCTPIIKNEEVVGAIAILEDMNAIQKIIDKMDSLINQANKAANHKHKMENIVGKSQVIVQLKENTIKAANVDSTILLRGETGTGKELFAHAIHMESSRKYGPFIIINCSAIPENLICAELFGLAEISGRGLSGHGKIGKFELADRGTLFIDDIGNVSFAVQTKILNIIQAREIQRIGDDRTKLLDVRIIAGTKHELDKLVKQNMFHEELYYKLSINSLYIPPLRERREDIETLINFMIEKNNKQYGKKVVGISTKAYNIFINHTWPGNVREMVSVMDQVFNVIEDQIIQHYHLPSYLNKMSNSQLQTNCSMSLKNILEDTECNVIRQALQFTGGNKVKAARRLGISRASLYQKIAKHNLLESNTGGKTQNKDLMQDFCSLG